jgi:hypothetical protein
MLSETTKPRSKSELIKRINNLRNIEMEIIEPVNRGNSINLRSEVSRFAGSKDVSVVLIKQR